MPEQLKMEFLISLTNDGREDAKITLATYEVRDQFIKELEGKGLKFTAVEVKPISGSKSAAAPTTGKKRGRPAKVATAPLLDQAAE